MSLITVYHNFNKDRKEAYLLCKYSADGKKLILHEKGPIKNKNKKTFPEKSK